MFECKTDMNKSSNQSIDTAKAYLEGMLWAAYGVKVIKL